MCYQAPHPYYTGHVRDLMRDFERVVRYGQGPIAARYGREFADDVLPEVRDAYRALIPQLPYIGGRSNPLTWNLIGSAWFLAIYRVFKARGKSIDEIGALYGEIMDAWLKRYPRLLLRLMGRLRFNAVRQRRLQERGRRSQERRYPDDWVFTAWREGPMAFAVDYTECGILKFLRAQGAEELAPYLCALDFNMIRAYGFTLVRTKTLAQGDRVCNFRISAYSFASGNTVVETPSTFTIWQETGITEHMGGLGATQQLIDACYLEANSRVLELGCGTGYTACRLAHMVRTPVYAIDLTSSVIGVARQRTERAGSEYRVLLAQASAYALPFPDDAFDRVICESVLLHCDRTRALAESYRVLRPGGILAANEVTLTGCPPPELRALLQSLTQAPSLTEDEWRATFASAGFEEIQASVARDRLVDQFLSHMKVDGLRRYVSAIIRSMSNPRLRRTYINRDMIRAARRFAPYVAYGIYISRKPV